MSVGLMRVGAAPLTSGLRMALRLEEASGNRVDSTGRGNTFFDINAPGNAAGKLGQAINLVAASSQYCYRPATTDLSPGNAAYEFTLWVWFNTHPGVNYIFSKYDADFGNKEWTLEYFSGQFYFTIWLDNTTSGTSVHTPGGVSTGGWHMLDCYHDPVTNKIGIALDGGAFTTATRTITPVASPATIRLGAAYSGAQGFHDGRIDQVCFWGRLLTTAERAAVWNGGAGLVL